MRCKRLCIQIDKRRRKFIINPAKPITRRCIYPLRSNTPARRAPNGGYATRASNASRALHTYGFAHPLWGLVEKLPQESCGLAWHSVCVCTSAEWLGAWHAARKFACITHPRKGAARRRAECVSFFLGKPPLFQAQCVRRPTPVNNIDPVEGSSSFVCFLLLFIGGMSASGIWGGHLVF